MDISITPEDNAIAKRVFDLNEQQAETITRKRITDELSFFLGDLTNINDDAYLGSAQKFYSWLVKPLEKELEGLGIDTLVYIMDEGLRNLPLAALHDGEQFLIEKYSLGTMPSVSLTDTSYQTLKEAQVLAMGTKDFPGADLKPLNAVPLELATIIGKTWPGKYFLDDEFTLENLRSQRSQNRFDIVHLATHAEFIPNSSNNARIYFRNQENSEGVSLDGLRNVRWYNEAMVQLLTLSACQTALGDRESELGFAGLAIGAGVKSALASFWKVDDLATLALMSKFYEELRSTDITVKAEALQAAQLAMLRGEITIKDGKLQGLQEEITLPQELLEREEGDLSHPFYWSSFTMIGSPW